MKIKNTILSSFVPCKLNEKTKIWGSDPENYFKIVSFSGDELNIISYFILEFCGGVIDVVIFYIFS